MLFDSHCHLTDPQFDADRDEVIQRAVDSGVTRMLTLATDVASSRAVVELCERYPAVYGAVGIHPEAVNAASARDLETLRELAAHPQVVALGEIGLDYYWDTSNTALQLEWFERQLELASELGLPVAVHDRQAHGDVLATLERAAASTPQRVRGVLHAFSGDLAMARAAFALGFVVSFGGPVTFKNNQTAPLIVPELALEKILIETDSPYLAPHPLRGKRNEPANVRLVAERLAQLQARTPDEVAAQTTRNANALLNLPDSA